MNCIGQMGVDTNLLPQLYPQNDTKNCQFLHGNDNTQANGNWPFKVASVLTTVRKNCPVRKWNWNVITLLTNKHTSKDKI